MLGLTLEETRVYREAKAEGREEGREEGRQEQIAQQLNVDVESVRLAAQQNQDK